MQGWPEGRENCLIFHLRDSCKCLLRDRNHPLSMVVTSMTGAVWVKPARKFRKFTLKFSSNLEWMPLGLVDHKLLEVQKVGDRPITDPRILKVGEDQSPLCFVLSYTILDCTDVNKKVVFMSVCLCVCLSGA